ncbi:MAG: molybdopterin-dependent oxidoreductase, partial [Rhodobiaceae bacterium]|nr:molybdopterin-dependent oxidoreductase [Rhodobiaceae bacterium]
IDLCPVGALTSRPYEFHARPWELRKTESIDVMDGLGSAIRVDTRGPEVMRIMPRLNEAVNEEWISDKSRFIWDGLKSQRLDRPFVRYDGKLVATGWQEAFAAVASAVNGVSPDRIGVIAGPMASVEEMFAMKALMTALGSANVDCRAPNSPLHPANGRAGYLFNSTVAGIENADALMIIGSNPRIESPVLNARIRKRWRMGNFPIAVIGENADLTYDYHYAGAGPQSLAALADHPPAQAERPMFIVGQGALNRPDGGAILSMAARAALSLGVVKDGWNGFNVLHTDASTVGGLDIGFVPGEGGKATTGMLAGDVDVLFLLGVDEYDLSNTGAKIIYIGTHGDRGAHAADVILPGAAYTEKAGTFVNTEGRAQTTLRAAFPPGEAREDWAILRALSATLGKTLPFDSFDQLRAALYAEFPAMMRLDAVEPADASVFQAIAGWGGGTSDAGFASPIADFYFTNPICRASQVMAECSALAASRMKGATGTDG